MQNKNDLFFWNTFNLGEATCWLNYFMDSSLADILVYNLLIYRDSSFLSSIVNSFWYCNKHPDLNFFLCVCLVEEAGCDNNTQQTSVHRWEKKLIWGKKFTT